LRRSHGEEIARAEQASRSHANRVFHKSIEYMKAAEPSIVSKTELV
jgi:hypothetical protein